MPCTKICIANSDKLKGRADSRHIRTFLSFQIIKSKMNCQHTINVMLNIWHFDNLPKNKYNKNKDGKPEKTHTHGHERNSVLLKILVTTQKNGLAHILCVLSLCSLQPFFL